jgi:hypothetical protein
MQRIETERRSPSNFLNLWQLKGPQVARLTREVSRTSGNVRVFIHPFYIAESSGFDEEPAAHRVYAKPRQEEFFLKTVKEAAEPIIVFEQGGGSIDYTKKRFLSTGILKPIYYIPTVPHNPQPALIVDNLRKLIQLSPQNQRQWNILEDKRLENLSWELALEKFASFGIKHINLTGRSYPGGCVGDAEEQFKKKFAVNVLPESYLENFLFSTD